MSFRRFVMHCGRFINLLDVYGILWFILKTNVLEPIHQGS